MDFMYRKKRYQERELSLRSGYAISVEFLKEIWEDYGQASFQAQRDARFQRLLQAEAFMDAVLCMLPPGFTWRLSFGADGASAYVASSSGRSVHNSVAIAPEGALCAAILKYWIFEGGL